MKKKIILYLFLFLIGLCIILASWFVINGDILFYSDIARDFLLMEDILYNKPIALIGPRSGAISGVFHGPLWLYLNLPAFILGKGNPIVVGWFWVLLYIINLIITYKIGKLLFDKHIGLIATLIVALTTISFPAGPSNPVGALILSPIFFYFLISYLKQKKIKFLVISLFILGLIIQFQIAFGGPVLILTFILILFNVIKHKKFYHLLAFLILIIPLSTYIIFDLRHNFLQTRSLINFFSQNIKNTNKNFYNWEIIKQKITHSVGSELNFITDRNILLNFFTIIILFIGFYQVFKNKKDKNKEIYLLFLYLYFGYWLIVIFYKGIIWWHYYWPFLPLLSIIVASFIKYINKKAFFVFIITLIACSFYTKTQLIIKTKNYFGQEKSSWLFYKNMAKTIYEDAPKNFGYFIFSDDNFGYPSWYAMNYMGKFYKNKKAIIHEKKETTYLIIDPSDNPGYSKEWWQKNMVKIDKNPEKVFQFNKSNFRVEKYKLNELDVKKEIDPTLIKTLIFR